MMTLSDQHEDEQQGQWESENDSMTVSFDITRADWETIVTKSLYNPRSTFRKGFYLNLSVAVTVGYLIYIASPPSGMTHWIPLGCYALVAVWILWKSSPNTKKAIQRTVDRMIVKSGKDIMFDSVSITISSANVRSEQTNTIQLRLWAGVKSIEEVSDDAVYIWTSPANFIRIPIRAFADEKSMHAFVERAEAWRRDAANAAKS